MESIIIYPKNKKQKSLIKSLLEAMKIRFEIDNVNSEHETLLSEKEFFAKIDNAIIQVEA